VLELLWLIPALPLAGFLVLLIGRPLGRRGAAAIGAGSVGAAMVAALALAGQFLAAPPPGGAFSQTLWRWIHVGPFAAHMTLHLDSLSCVMIVVVTVVGFLIHVYSTAFMADDEGYSRFFAYMNLFVGCMLLLVLGGDLLVLLLGWEGVGLCSYLLIGFWYTDPANGRAARKAFIVTRVGDMGFILALVLLFTSLGTLNIQDLAGQAAARWPVGSPLAVAAAGLLLAGAVGKSAQLPLQVWLPDAMAGPTPTSALIHAATMVTAGVYLIARMHAIFELAPAVQSVVAVIGAATLVLAGFSAATQRDFKRVIAYSTISQIGYMFLAMGVGAYAAGIYHFTTHAFFKSLLFLAAGVVIRALHEEHDLFKMGGLRRDLPGTWWVFLAGSLALVALPPTAGFASKDAILYHAWSAPGGGTALWAAGLGGVFLTALYTFRMVFLAFCGAQHTAPARRPGAAMLAPMAVLAAACFALSALDWPEALGGRPWMSDFLHRTLPQARPAVAGRGGSAVEWALMGVSLAVCLAVCLAGVLAAWLLVLRARPAAERFAARRLAAALHALWAAGWGFDWLYDRLLVGPYVWLANRNRDDVFDLIYLLAGRAAAGMHRALNFLQNGQVRWYAAGIALGAVVMVVVMVLT
jgi:NADH-quinone oxidoreductase subunit L